MPGLHGRAVVFSWLVRRAAWLAARFQVRATDKATAYRIVNGVDYQSPVCVFGETVMAKLPNPATKVQKCWVKGLWVGRLERDNSNIILTEAGALTVRSVRPAAGSPKPGSSHGHRGRCAMGTTLGKTVAGSATSGCSPKRRTRASVRGRRTTTATGASPRRPKQQGRHRSAATRRSRRWPITRGHDGRPVRAQPP